MFCNRRFSPLAFRGLARPMVAFAMLAILLISRQVVGQDANASGRPAKPYPASPGLRTINHPSIPTGQIGDFATLQRNLGVQPVEWKLPEGVTVEVANLGAFEAAPDETPLFGLQVGAVYRFKLSGIATYPGQNLYPTLEIIGKLNPPAGKEWDFPVEVEIPMRDLALALRGNFVTRVIFVENSVNAASVDASKTNENLTFDIPSFLDPVAAANYRGRALAILRIGSREPDAAPDPNDPFFFGLPKVVYRAADNLAEPETAAIVDVAETLQSLDAAEEVAAESETEPTEFQIELPEEVEAEIEETDE